MAEGRTNSEYKCSVQFWWKWKCVLLTLKTEGTSLANTIYTLLMYNIFSYTY